MAGFLGGGALILGHPIRIYKNFRISDEDGGTPEKRYRDYWGFFISILKLLEEKRNFKANILNDPMLMEGNLNYITGEPIGLWGNTSRGEYSFCYPALVHLETNMNSLWVQMGPSDSGLGFVSPLPKPYISYLALVKPLSLIVWNFLMASVLIFGIALFTVAKFEGQIFEEHKLMDYLPLYNGIWFCFRSMINQANASTDTRNLNALRCVLLYIPPRGR